MWSQHGMRRQVGTTSKQIKRPKEVMRWSNKIAEYKYAFLKCLQPYVVHVKDVGTNGNCGCWAIACTLGMGSMIGHRLGKTCFGSYIAIFNGIWGLRQTNEK